MNHLISARVGMKSFMAEEEGANRFDISTKLIAAQNEYKTLMKGQYCTYSSYTLEIHAKCHHKRLTSDCIMRLCNADGGYQTTAQ